MNQNKWLGATAGAILAGVGLATLALSPMATAGGEACRRAMERERARLGPPLVCHPIDIGDAKSLAFGTDAFETKKGYSTEQVVKDTLKLLEGQDSTLVRMETLRRATVYVRGDKSAATELLAKLSWNALDAEARADQKSAGDERARAWFDAGYLAACLAQLDVDIDGKPGEADGVVGYAWIKEALKLSGNDPEMEFAAALATHPGMRDSKRDLFEQHIRLAGADSDPLLAKNLKTHLAIWGESLDQIVGKDKDGTRDASRQR